MEGENNEHHEHHENHENHEHIEHTHTHLEHHSNHKKLNWKKILLFGGLALLVILAIILLIIAFKPSQTVEKYNVSYTLTLADGTEILNGNSIFNQNSFSSDFGFISTKIDNELKSMNIGEEKTLTLNAEEAFGEYDPELNISTNRTQEIDKKMIISRNLNVTLTDFTGAFNEQPILNKEYILEGDSFTYVVTNIDANNIQLRRETKMGEIIPGSLFPMKVISINETNIGLDMQAEKTVMPTDSGDWEIDYDNNKIYLTLTPTIGQALGLGTVTGMVTGYNDKQIFIDANVPYAGQSITIKLRLENRIKEKIATSNIKKIDGAPTMQVYIMSHCPYGTQIVKGLLPVWKEFQDKANIELRFVSYTMHGAQEELDNQRIICIREEQSAKLIDYMECFVSATGSEADSQNCLKKVGIDETKLQSCMDSRVDAYFEVDKGLNTQYSVQGSPTIVINGKEASIYPRDPQSVANALCDAFGSNKPNECSVSFSTSNPSAGFGVSSGSSSASGSC